MRRAMWTLL